VVPSRTRKQRRSDGDGMFGKLLLTAILTTTPAFAQRGGGGGGDEMGATGMSMPRPQPVSKAVMFADRLKLDKDQKEKAQVILNDALKEINQLRPQLLKTRAQIAEFILRNASQDEINKLVESYSASAAQVTGIEVKAFGKICELLKPDQQSRAASAFDLLAAVLDPPGSTGRGGFSGARRGKQ
jgi:hypothetical protein